MAKIPRAINKRTLDNNFVPGREYTFPYICEACHYKYPPYKEKRYELWDRMDAAGAIWERPKRGYRLYKYLGIKEPEKKEKPVTQPKLRLLTCARAKIINNGAVGIWLTKDDLSRLYFGYEVQEMSVPEIHDDKSAYGLEYGRACEIFNGVVAVVAYKMIREFTGEWQSMADKSVLVNKDRIAKSYYFTRNDEPGVINIALPYMAAEISRMYKDQVLSQQIQLYCGTSWHKYKSGRSDDIKDYESRENIKIGKQITRFDFIVTDLPKKYSDDELVSRTLTDKLIERTGKYLNSNYRKKNTYYPKWMEEHDINMVERLLAELFDKWKEAFTSGLFDKIRMEDFLEAGELIDARPELLISINPSEERAAVFSD